MHKLINVSPPDDFETFSPSELFRFFFQIGHWTEESFSEDFQTYARGQLISTVTISKWKNKDVIPKRYSGAFFRLINNIVEPEIAANWVAAFETVWALHTARRAQKLPQSNASHASDMIRTQHSEWIKRLYSEKSLGDAFAPSDIYVPLQLSEIGNSVTGPQTVEDIIEMVDTPNRHSNDMSWIFVSGGPGSGKSMTALHMAKALCEENIYPIFLRGGRLSKIDIDISNPSHVIDDSFSMRSFLEHFRASSLTTACLILDGLDEIGLSAKGSSIALSHIISELKAEQAACNAHNKTLHVIAFGRDAHVQFFSKRISPVNAPHFILLSLDGSLRGHKYEAKEILGQDLRPLWWSKYLKSIGEFDDPSLPDFLSTEYDDFADFGAVPLLCSLICETALSGTQATTTSKLPHERVNEVTYTSNKNEIYRTTIERISESLNHKVTSKQLLSVLQHIALAIWHSGDKNRVSLQTVYDDIKDPQTRASLQALNMSLTTLHTASNILVTTFYYLLVTDETTSHKPVIEFTHKTFSEYLVSNLLFDRFTELLSNFDNQSKFLVSLKNWIHVSSAGSHSPTLADFCQKEAALRFDALSELDWDITLKICREHISGKLFDGNGLSSIAQIQHSSSLLFFLWSCLNLERQKRTGEHFPLSPNTQKFRSNDLKSLQKSNSLSFSSSSPIEAALENQTLLTPSLSALYIQFSDMSQLSFSHGHIEHIICVDVNFAMTHWSHVKVTAARFNRSIFQQVIFHQWRVASTEFSKCFFQGSRFEGATFSKCYFKDTFFSQCHFSDVEFLSSNFKMVVFDRCVFTRSDFSKIKESPFSFDIQFRHCTFIDMESAFNNIPSERIENTIHQDLNGKTGPSAIKNYELEKSLRELL